MAKWEWLSQEERELVRGLGHDPESMMVDRVGEEHWLFKNLKTQGELIVSMDGGRPRGTYIKADITPPVRRK